MKKTTYKKINNIDYSKFTHVVYAHSFTDAQLIFGKDGFINSKDWIMFTLNNLLKEKKIKSCLKRIQIFIIKVWENKQFGIKKYLIY